MPHQELCFVINVWNSYGVLVPGFIFRVLLFSILFDKFTPSGFCHLILREYIIFQHLFCEECVAAWFDRERTCPMCRAKVADDPAWRDGTTSLVPQLF